MPNVNDIIGSVIPNVYVKKISLETAGDIVFDRNPHIDHEREPDVVRNPETGKLEREELRPLLLKKSNESKMLTIDVELVIREKFDDGLITSWFGNQDFIKYFKVHVVQSRNPELSEKLGEQKVTLEQVKSLPGVEFRNVVLKDIIGTNAITKYPAVVDADGTKIYDIPFRLRFNITMSDPEHLSYFAASYFDIGELANDFDMEWDGQFNLLQGRLASETVIDGFEIISETFMFFDEFGDEYPGPTHQLSTGQWAEGAFPTEDERLLTVKKISNSKIQDFRNVEQLENLKLDLFAFETKALAKFIKQQPNTKILINSTIQEDKDSPYFSDFNITRDSKGNCRFIFGVDFLRLIRENTIFGEMYKDGLEMMRNVRITSLEVSRIRVKNNALKQGNTEERLMEFNSNDPPERLVVAGENFAGSFPGTFKDAGALREVHVQLGLRKHSIRHFTGIDKAMNKITFGIYKYSVKLEIEDDTVKFLQEQYRKLIESETILQNYYNQGSMFDNFNHDLNKFSQDFVQGQEALYANNLENASWILPVAIYLETLHHFVNEFDTTDYEAVLLNLVSPKTGNLDGIQLLVQLMRNLASKLQFVIESGGATKYRRHVSGQDNALRTAVRFRQSSPRRKFTIEKGFASLFDSNVMKDVGFDFLSMDEFDVERNDDGLNVISAINYDKRTEIETLKYYKAKDLDINMRSTVNTYTKDDNLDNSRYMYLTPSRVNIGKTISTSKFEKKGTVQQLGSRAQEEIATGLMRYNSLKQSPQIPLTSRGIQENSSLSEKEQTIKNNVIGLFEPLGVAFRSISSLRDGEREKIADSDIGRFSETIESERVMGTGSTFNSEDSSVHEQKMQVMTNDAGNQDLTQNPNNLLLSLSDAYINYGFNEDLIPNKSTSQYETMRRSISFYNLNRPENALNVSETKLNSIKKQNSDISMVEQEKKSLGKDTVAVDNKAPYNEIETEQFIKDLPNQIKSLFVGSISKDKVNIDWFGGDGDPLKDARRKIEFMMDYGVIGQIEVLIGYEEDNMKKPIWRKLTIGIFNNTLNKNLLCRLTEYNNRALGIFRSEAFSLPIYNEYFIISPEEQLKEPSIEEKQPPKDLVLNDVTRRLLDTHNQNISVATEMYADAWARAKRARKTEPERRREVTLDEVTSRELETAHQNISVVTEQEDAARRAISRATLVNAPPSEKPSEPSKKSSTIKAFDLLGKK